ncbi:MAG: Lrp/AsnC family transcriptional regulator [Candidatus Bathyarchaeia archaeon]
MVDVDELDKKLIAELQKKANTPLHEIAKKLGTSTMTISRRIRKLTSLGVIKKFTVLIDQGRLGKSASAFMLLHISSISKVNQVAEKISEIEDIEELYITWSSGTATCIAKVNCRDIEDLQHLLKSISTMDGVINIELYPISRLIKA